jgi:PAS domain S-box-containing protein
VTEALPGIENDPSDWIGVYGKVALTGKEVQFENYSSVLRKWFKISAYAPQTGYFVAIFEDVTDRRKTEKDLKENEERYRFLHEQSGVGIGYYAPDGTVISYNNQALRNIGMKREDAIGKSIFDLFPKADAEKYFDRIKQALAVDGMIEFSDLLDLPVGRVYFLSTFMKICNERGEPIGVQIISKDITKLKQAEKELQEAKQVIEGVINAIPVRVFWKDKDLKYLGCNAVFARDAGFTDPKELIGKDDFQMGWRDQAELYRADDRQVIDSGQAKLNIDEPQTTPDGRTIWLLTSKIPYKDADGKISGVIGTYMDISELKQAEAESRRAKETLQAKVNELERFNALTVDREMKMVELKNRIKELEEKMIDKSK